MVYVYYLPEVKALAVKLYMRNISIEDINNLVEADILARSFRRWSDLFIATSSVVRDPALYEQRGAPLLITSEEREFILDILRGDPTLYLDEIQRALEEHSGFPVSRATIHRDLHLRLNLTHKVARTVHPGQCPLKRAAYFCKIANFPPEFLVFTDESAICRDALMHNKGWAPQGERTERVPRRNDATRLSLLPAVSLDGILGMIAQPGSIQRPDFEFFLEQVLLPAMNPFPGRNSVLVLDNTSIHHNDFNPIKKVFLVVKSNLRRDRILKGTDEDAEIIKDYVGDLVTPELMRAEFRGCGYV
ncbi:uncharacterized protein PGTG_22221 [Puccinia graminis f. sp. tritici CRL 75-36-700-3]|uniref:Tc1-like transposase DDE domain-containing protein n=1 Tax=Puccinia graminis f. sp. tritici (strain CRL 75-36-700-3 / race SCCL) TaxID=418459 RepID=H6QTX5_PUCGT|nr:uncharacterized protein PGTG_22221 [Puccinia graminis f. sp. tritici CRL 75-36-700-3]EHS64389.1 hypothetical protein PGTG_22221 [Puccinia graminis f. sp. tritici CRL 75-36-700-3]